MVGWSALDGRRLYAHARAASFVYQAVLRAELTRSLGLEWLPVRNGIAELLGVSKPVLARVQPAARRDRGGDGAPWHVGAARAEAAALTTRQAKRADSTLDDLVADWRARAAELGFDASDLGRLLGRARTPTLDQAAWARRFDELASPTGLTRRASTFSRRDVV